MVWFWKKLGYKCFGDFYFGIKPEEQPKKLDIAIGDIFIFGVKEEKNPFARRKRLQSPTEVKVLDIEDGYVQYKMVKYCNAPEDSCKINTFLRMYQKKHK